MQLYNHKSNHEAVCSVLGFVVDIDGAENMFLRANSFSKANEIIHCCCLQNKHLHSLHLIADVQFLIVAALKNIIILD